MNESTKGQLSRDICKSHSARSDRELTRIRPSNLTKRELEDLYFALQEDNVGFKKTINEQQEKIKLLSTKLLRMTASQKYNSCKDQNCCPGTKATLQERNASIADLKKANERMAERIRQLNMRLCSAKQFVKATTTQSVRCSRCCTTPSSKNTSTSALFLKKPDSLMKTSACQYTTKDSAISKEAETEIHDKIQEMPPSESAEEIKVSQKEKEYAETSEDNKCRVQIDELKMKIIDLQEELSSSQMESSSRLSRLEDLVSRLDSALRSERARGERALSGLREATANYEDVAAQLYVEKRKVVELETRLKAAEMSNEVSRTIQHLSKEALRIGNNIIMSPPRNTLPFLEKISAAVLNDEGNNQDSDHCSTQPASELVALEILKSPRLTTSFNVPAKSVVCATSKTSDDSGFIDPNRSVEDCDQSSTNGRNLWKQMSDLQAQLDELKVTAVSQVNVTASAEPVDKEKSETKNIMTPMCEKERRVSVSENSELRQEKDSLASDTSMAKIITPSQDLTSEVSERICSDEKPVTTQLKIEEKNSDNDKQNLNDNRTQIPGPISTERIELRTKPGRRKSVQKSGKRNSRGENKRVNNGKLNNGTPQSSETGDQSPLYKDTALDEEPKCTRAQSNVMLDKQDNQLGCIPEQAVHEVAGAGAPSPDNTDYEVPSLAESPPPAAAVSPRSYTLSDSPSPSPGERLSSVAAYSPRRRRDSDSAPLSDGEVPYTDRALSVGEKPMDAEGPKKNAVRAPETSSISMEGALRDITQELTRCKRLLLLHRQPESSASDYPGELSRR